MKIKTMITSIVAGAGILAMVGSASAACFQTGVAGTPTVPTKDLNIYGASAQFTFWKSEFKNYLQAAGCVAKGNAANATDWANASATSSDSAHFVVQADCSGVGGPATVNFRVSSKASYDGPPAVANKQTIYTTNNCGTGVNLKQREMLHGGVGTCAWGSTACTPPTQANGDCEAVNWGASDVAVGDFKQVSDLRNFTVNPVILTGAGTVAVTDFCSPNAISFGFFLNKNVISQSTGTYLNFISPIEIKMIYSGKLTNWNQLVSNPSNTLAIVACARDAGSGTAATMDFMMMKPTQIFQAGSATQIFNDGTGPMMNCVNNNAGAIGYADADRPNLANTYGPIALGDATFSVAPTTANVKTLAYDFVTPQHAYVANTDRATNMFLDLCTYAGWPAKLAVVNANWAATCEMTFLPANKLTLATWAPSTVLGTGGCTCP